MDLNIIFYRVIVIFLLVTNVSVKKYVTDGYICQIRINDNDYSHERKERHKNVLVTDFLKYIVGIVRHKSRSVTTCNVQLVCSSVALLTGLIT